MLLGLAGCSRNESSAAHSSYQVRQNGDISGLKSISFERIRWDANASLEEIAGVWRRAGYKDIESIDENLAHVRPSDKSQLDLLRRKAAFYNFEGEPIRAYEVLEHLRSLVESNDQWKSSWLYSVVFMQGVTALRIGETENCVMCRGESSCILPISPAAVHTKPEGSRLAIKYFTEYLEQFPNDLEVRWLLNLAHMTLGEHPHDVDPRFLVRLDQFSNSEFDIGKFRDVGPIVGVNRLNQSGGAIMEDFDNDGLLDIALTTWDSNGPMSLYRNRGDGTFEDRSEAAGVADQLGGLYCVQTDFDNDGHMDIFVARGAWWPRPIRPTLLRNDGDGTFTDVTVEAGLLNPVNSIAVSWGDYDNDGWLDLFICCEKQLNRLYHNKADGTFEEVASQAGVDGAGRSGCKGSAWIDYDNDGYDDLFLNYLEGPGGGELYHNQRDGTFTNVTIRMNIDGPEQGFSCWAWDYDNDGWLDIFAASYDGTDGKLGEIVKGMIDGPRGRSFSRLYHNRQGRGFEDTTQAAGLDMAFAVMGSNFGDFDNDGYLDMYLSTGAQDLWFLVPNRMFKNVDGQRFAEITGTSGTGNLQKGHAIACGDWDRDGDTDIFAQMGGPTNGDKYHDILFQNPGQPNHGLTVKLIGKKTNRAAIGARIKVVTAGEEPMTVHRHVSSGSSFGANPLQQTIGLGRADRVASLEIHWPTSGTTQVFRDIAADQVIEVTEFAEDYRKLDWTPVPFPK